MNRLTDKELDYLLRTAQAEWVPQDMARRAVEELAERRAALAQPPGPAPSMEEVERARLAYANACEQMGIAHASGTRAEWEEAVHGEIATRSALLASIRALAGPDRYAEGWEAARREDVQWCRLNLSDSVADDLARSLPTPNPEDRR